MSDSSSFIYSSVFAEVVFSWFGSLPSSSSGLDFARARLGFSSFVFLSLETGFVSFNNFFGASVITSASSVVFAVLALTVRLRLGFSAAAPLVAAAGVKACLSRIR